MASTMRRRALRRARQGGRSTYRALRRHRAVAVGVAVAAALTLGTAAAAVPDGPGATGTPMDHSQFHRPLPGEMPGHGWGMHRD